MYYLERPGYMEVFEEETGLCVATVFKNYVELTNGITFKYSGFTELEMAKILVGKKLNVQPVEG